MQSIQKSNFEEILQSIIFFKIFNYKNKFNLSRSNKLLCFDDFSNFKHL